MKFEEWLCEICIVGDTYEVTCKYHKGLQKERGKLVFDLWDDKWEWPEDIYNETSWKSQALRPYLAWLRRKNDTRKYNTSASETKA